MLAQLAQSRGSILDSHVSSSTVGSSSNPSSSTTTHTPGLRLRYVSKNPANPAAFVYYKGSPYLEQIALPNPVDSLASLVGPAAIDQAMSA